MAVRGGVAVDDDRRLRIAAELVGVRHDVGARAPEEDLQVRGGERLAAHRGGSDAERPEVVRVGVIDAVVGAEVGEDPYAAPGRPRGHGRRGLRIPHLPAGDEHGPPRTGDRGVEELEVGGRRSGLGDRPRGHGGPVGPGELGLLRQPDDDRAGAAGDRGVHGVGDDPGGGGGVVEDEHLLRRRPEPAAEVELLERLAPAHLGGDEADEHDERGGVLVGVVDCDHDVRGARPAGHHGDAGSAGEAALGDGHVAGAALLPAHDGADRGVVEAVEHVEVGLPGHAVDPVDAVALELPDDEVAGRARSGARAPGRGLRGGRGGGCGFVAHGTTLTTDPVTE